MIKLVIEPLAVGEGGGCADLTAFPGLDALTADSNASLQREHARDFVAWRIYFTAEEPLQADAPGQPVWPGDLEGKPELLAPLWSRFLDWVGSRTDRLGLVLNDTLWVEGSGWQDLRDALATGIGEMRLKLEPTEVEGLHAAVLDIAAVKHLFEIWWPSRAGGLHGVALSRGARTSLDEVTLEGLVPAERLGDLEVVFETDRSLENLGLIVISRGTDWTSLERELGKYLLRTGSSVA